MKTKLSPEDRERIEQEAFATFGSGILTYPAFIKGAEYENKYQRAQQPTRIGIIGKADPLSVKLLNAVNKIKQLEAEHTDLLAKVSEQEKEIERLREERKELVEALREAEGHLPDDSAGRHISKKAQSLLSKFEVPNQS